MPQPRIAVFLKLQNPNQEQAQHSASRSLASIVLLAFYAKPILVNGQLSAIHLNTLLSWREVKDIVRPKEFCRRLIHKTSDSGMDHPWSWYPGSGA